MILMSMFEYFDPTTSTDFALNWMVISFYIFLTPFSYWLIPSRVQMFWLLMMKMLYNEFSIVLSYKRQSNIMVILSLMNLIMMMNFLGMMPYIFVITSNLSFSLIFSYSMWMSIMLYVVINSMKEFLVHLVPLNTPFMLMNFMVYIELISNLIRPLTLAIRLTANLIAGHLLMSLLGSFMMSLNILNVFLFMMIQNLLVMLEISMAFIQAYVFSILMTLYLSEAK